MEAARRDPDLSPHFVHLTRQYQCLSDFHPYRCLESDRYIQAGVDL